MTGQGVGEAPAPEPTAGLADHAAPPVDDGAWAAAARAELAQLDATLASSFRADCDIDRLLKARTAGVDTHVVAAWRRCVGPGDGLALFAVGGYGRGELFPQSDIDLLVLAEPRAQAMAHEHLVAAQQAGLATLDQVAHQRFVDRPEAFHLAHIDDFEGLAVVSDGDLGAFIADCLTDASRHNRVLPIGGPGEAITPRQQGEHLFALLGRPPRFKSVPVGLLDAVIAVLGAAGRVVPALADMATNLPSLFLILAVTRPVALASERST